MKTYDTAADFAVRLAGLTLEHPIMNGAGVCKGEELPELLNSAAGAIVIGSITKEGRLGNDGTTYWSNGQASINSLGLPNAGATFYQEHLGTMVDEAHAAGKPLFLSIAGFTPDEYAELYELGGQAGVDLVEANLGCPNVWEGREQKRIASFDPEAIDRVLRAITALGWDASELPLALKVSPYSDPSLLAEVAAVVKQHSVVRVLTTMNTFPNAYAVDEVGTARITAAGGFGGYAGPAIKPIGIGQVRQWRAHLPDRIQIIGVGGVSTGRDVRDYVEAGASAVQVVTAYCQHGRRVFERILSEYVTLVAPN
ncbi:dihydroorotate dehydrogenase [Candidatus Berkelbacteria bacterium]|nr:dihydroorotate dehydrogenase [Candidatus Berkelbacteria bacterium]